MFLLFIRENAQKSQGNNVKGVLLALLLKESTFSFDLLRRNRTKYEMIYLLTMTGCETLCS